MLTALLPPGLSVDHMMFRVERALDDLSRLRATREALAYWLAGPYRRALANPKMAPFGAGSMLPEDIPSAMRTTHVALVTMRMAAMRGDVTSVLPPQVDVVQMRDRTGGSGFAPFHTDGAALSHRALSLLLAHYLTCPERYVGRQTEA